LKTLRHYLLVYDRSTGKLVECRDLGEDRSGALAQRFAIEKRERSHPDIEVVVLSADSLETLRSTHSRYFRTMSELTSDFSAGVLP
jgi:hypothetical protein